MHFSLRGSRVLFDEPVPFTIEAAVPGTHIEVFVEFSVAGEVLRSSAIFVADERGSIDPARVAPLEGSYTGVDGRGLYWSADPEAAWPTRPSIDDVPVRVVGRIDGAVVATVEFLRALVGDRVEIVDVNDGPTLRFFRPSGRGPFPGVVVVGGSEGGRASADVVAAALASRGVASLAVAYFGLEGLPTFHHEVPIENVHRAIHWLCAHTDVRPGGVGVYGSSRGGELALLLGATSPDVSRVVANAPSGVVWSGTDSSGPTLGSAWSLEGRPVPWLQRRPDSEANRAASAADEVELRAVFEDELRRGDRHDLDRGNDRRGARERTDPDVLRRVRCDVAVDGVGRSRCRPCPRRWRAPPCRAHCVRSRGARLRARSRHRAAHLGQAPGDRQANVARRNEASKCSRVS